MRTDYMQACRWIGVTLTPEQHVAFALLESRGFRFLVHFGVQNAIAKADALCDFSVKH